jgi:hypothetical protein
MPPLAPEPARSPLAHAAAPAPAEPARSPLAHLAPAKRPPLARAAAIATALFFLIAACLQLNDPDPYLWVPLYLAAAAHAAAPARVGARPAAAAAAAAALLCALSAPRALADCARGPCVASESFREAAGAALALASLRGGAAAPPAVAAAAAAAAFAALFIWRAALEADFYPTVGASCRSLLARA